MTALALTSLEFGVERYGVLMAPEPGNPQEAEGILNPAGVAGPDGHYYLFPRLVAAGNVSRIGVGRLRRDTQDRPCAVERLGIALAPSAWYDRRGCEDARVTRLPALGCYVMCYTAWDGVTARIGLATSRDLRAWRRHGPVGFAPEGGVDFALYPNKDAILFPEPVQAPNGALCVALLHRPIYQQLSRDAAGRGAWTAAPLPRGITDGRPSLWLSYCPLASFEAGVAAGAAPVFSPIARVVLAPRKCYRRCCRDLPGRSVRHGQMSADGVIGPYSAWDPGVRAGRRSHSCRRRVEYRRKANDMHRRQTATGSAPGGDVPPARSVRQARRAIDISDPQGNPDPLRLLVLCGRTFGLAHGATQRIVSAGVGPHT